MSIAILQRMSTTFVLGAKTGRAATEALRKSGDGGPMLQALAAAGAATEVAHIAWIDARERAEQEPAAALAALDAYRDAAARLFTLQRRMLERPEVRDEFERARIDHAAMTAQAQASEAQCMAELAEVREAIAAVQVQA